MSDQYLTVREVAEAVGRCTAAVRRACQRGQLTDAVLVPESRGAAWRIPARYADPEAYRAAVGLAG